jgi:predicted lysophospholipase L1 biosynthesis ABC-type transport system permease subunit
MRAIRVLLYRLFGLFDNQRMDREFAEEMENHLRMQIEDNIRAGMTPEQARRDALIRSGGLVLLIACFNVASFLIARAAARQKEGAVRLALGASRGQLIRQLLIESTVLSVAGGSMGLLLSVVMIRGLLGFLPARGMLLAIRAEPDWRILAFSAVLVILTALLFGLAPAWQSVRVDLSSWLRGAEGAIAGGTGSARLRRGLVTAQVAFSFLLLTGAGLFVRTLANLKQTNPGFRDIDRPPHLSGGSSPQRLFAAAPEGLLRAIAEKHTVAAGGEVGRLFVDSRPERT